ncbi:MAG TPA: phosphate ABC transporter permease PstA [Acidimicrobiales bacterium]|nr:phosphate ABC transporter permease PstA [Acidimicrobiales bacterium]
MAVVETPVAPAGSEGTTLTAKRTDVKGQAFKVVLISSLVIALVILLTLIWDMWSEGRPILTTRLWQFLTTGLASDPAIAGVWQGIKGTLMLGVIVALISFPMGIATAIYLEEYAGDTRFARIVNINIRNLAGVPSIVYGLLGLAIFVQLLGENGRGGLTGGRTVISGGLTLALLVLPIVIITAQEALRAVPAGIREGSLALGATRFETTRHHVVPAAGPGILTGTVLALARAAGEAAPLLVVGAVTGVFFVGAQGIFEQITSGRFTALPMVIFSWARLPAGQGWNANTGAAAIVLLALILAMNGLAIYLRNRFERKW